MGRRQTRHTAEPNRLLQSLSRPVYKRLMNHLQPLSMPVRQEVFRQGGPVDYIYFPRSGVISLVTTMRDGSMVECATVGPEGMVGIGVVFDVVHSKLRTFCQTPVEACRIKAGIFKREMERNGELHLLLGRYAQALIIQFTQGMACNRLHSIEQRCARWLLMTHDRVLSDTLPLTQEFLGQMLGVRRASVTVVANILQRQGLINYRRGVIRVLDRKGLEKVSCECYATINAEFERSLRGN